MAKELVVGTYEHGMKDNVVYSNHAFGGTDWWDLLIRKNKWLNKKLEVVLRPVEDEIKS